ncbi:YojF family protein [Paenisporosarcina cavernae]|uniref:DUF1806 family protein n=1 Tax=Paenisporosarcina cavernae TaxID=2320858 RepID=A0A385YRZ1_9BACL|nr:YojF family protein [Paenisporosarcina cavernae]AYC28767.1 DUF1806 family protein [Paenisporosarcina cavernae]
MELVDVTTLQTHLSSFENEAVYIHLETTNGAYASHFNENVFNSGAFVRNVQITYELAKVVGESPHRVGLKMTHGWVYAQGITHFEMDNEGRLLMAGHDQSGKLAVALQISRTPFSY